MLPRRVAFAITLVTLCSAGCSSKSAPTAAGPPPPSTGTINFAWNETIVPGDCNYSNPKWTVILEGAAKDSFVLYNNNGPPTFCEMRWFQRGYDNTLPLTIRVVRRNDDGLGAVDTSYTYLPQDSLARVWHHTCREQGNHCQCVPAEIILGTGRYMGSKGNAGDSGPVPWPPDIAICTPRASAIPNSLDFGSVPLGTSVDLTFQLRNESGTTLTGTVSSPCPEFRIVYMDGMPVAGGEATYQLGGSVVFVVRFTPTATGQRDCTLNTGWVEVPCTGLGATP